MDTEAEANLRHFQEYGDPDSLLEYIRLTGKDTARYKLVLRILLPVFDPLGHGEYPRYHDIDDEQLQLYEPEVRVVASSMAASEKADLRESGTRLLELLNERA